MDEQLLQSGTAALVQWLIPHFSLIRCHRAVRNQSIPYSILAIASPGQLTDVAITYTASKSLHEEVFSTTCLPVSTTTTSRVAGSPVHVTFSDLLQSRHASYDLILVHGWCDASRAVLRLHGGVNAVAAALCRVHSTLLRPAGALLVVTQGLPERLKNARDAAVTWLPSLQRQRSNDSMSSGTATQANASSESESDSDEESNEFEHSSDSSTVQYRFLHRNTALQQEARRMGCVVTSDIAHRCVAAGAYLRMCPVGCNCPLHGDAGEVSNNHHYQMSISSTSLLRDILPLLRLPSVPEEQQSNLSPHIIGDLRDVVIDAVMSEPRLGSLHKRQNNSFSSWLWRNRLASTTEDEQYNDSRTSYGNGHSSSNSNNNNGNSLIVYFPLRLQIVTPPLVSVDDRSTNGNRVNRDTARAERVSPSNRSQRNFKSNIGSSASSNSLHNESVVHASVPASSTMINISLTTSAAIATDAVWTSDEDDVMAAETVAPRAAVSSWKFSWFGLSCVSPSAMAAHPSSGAGVGEPTAVPSNRTSSYRMSMRDEDAGLRGIFALRPFALPPQPLLHAAVGHTIHRHDDGAWGWDAARTASFDLNFIATSTEALGIINDNQLTKRASTQDATALPEHTTAQSGEGTTAETPASTNAVTAQGGANSSMVMELDDNDNTGIFTHDTRNHVFLNTAACRWHDRRARWRKRPIGRARPTPSRLSDADLEQLRTSVQNCTESLQLRAPTSLRSVTALLHEIWYEEGFSTESATSDESDH